MISYLLPQRAAVVQSQGHPAAGVIGWWDKSSNSSGIPVNEQVALTYSAVWAATRIISETVATLPCILYRRLPGGGKERATDDSRYDLLHTSPNEMMTAYTFLETATSHVVLWGNSYARIIDVGGPVSIELRLPGSVRVELSDNRESLRYYIDELGEDLTPDEMLHVAGLSSDGIQGYSVVKQAAQSIGSALAAEKYAGSFFGNGARPSGVLTFPQRLDREKREAFRREWESIHKGADESNKVAILHGGMEYKSIGMSNEDAQFLESRQFSVSEIARWFRLPPHLLGDLTRATFSNIEQQALEFVKYSITPWLRRWETTLNKKLLRPAERGDMFYEFLVDSLLRGDIESRYSAYATGRQWGWLSVNEIRNKENLNPVEDGDVYLQPMNMQPAGEPLPETIAEAWQSNLMASIDGIREQAVGMREAIAADVGQVARQMASAEVALCERLSGLREQQECIRHELATPRIAQIQGVDLVIEAAWDVIEQVNDHSRKRMAAASIKAAKGQEFTGEPFLPWAERYFADAEEWYAARVDRPKQALEKLGHDMSTLAADHVAKHMAAVLACADGPREGFAARVAEAVADWQ